MPFLISLEVVYGEEPADALKEVNGLSSNINDGFDGEMVSLVPCWTETDDWLSGEVTVGDFELKILDQATEAYGVRDLAKGAGGKFRYLFPFQSPDGPLRITEIALIRRKEDGPPPHLEPGTVWHASTGDINAGRGGDYLYLVWKMDDREGQFSKAFEEHRQRTQ